MNNNEPGMEYSEVQRFRVWWAWGAVIALNVLFGYAFVQQIMLDKPFGDTPISNVSLTVVEILALTFLYFLFSIRLKTAINKNGIYYRFYPFQTKTTLIEWHELSDAYMREYNSFYEYGGWGIRVGSSKNSRAINTSASGNIGLQLEFKDGRLLMIGTKNPEVLSKVIDQHIAAGRIRWGV